MPMNEPMIKSFDLALVELPELLVVEDDCILFSS